HALRRSCLRQIALDGKENFAGEDFADLVIGFAREKSAQRFVLETMFLKIGQQAFDGIGDVGGGAAITNWPRDGRNLSEAAADTEIIGIHKLAVLLDLLAFNADVGDPVLAAAIWAASNVQLDL